jgi:hypothetical protein
MERALALNFFTNPVFPILVVLTVVCINGMKFAWSE